GGGRGGVPARRAGSGGGGVLGRGRWGGPHHFPGAICPPLECHSASRTVTSVSHLVIRLRGTWVSAAQAIAVYQANAHGATMIHAKVSAKGATTSRGWSDEIFW